jgi:hypothetical protein
MGGGNEEKLTRSDGRPSKEEANRSRLLLSPLIEHASKMPLLVQRARQKIAMLSVPRQLLPR